MSARISAQAKTVLEVLASKRCHLTAEEILANLEHIGTATVYRALDHLTEMGLIRRLSVGKRSAVYEYIRDQHMHLVCSRCGAVVDVQADMTGMIREAARCCGHKVEFAEVNAHGMCKACCEAEAQQDAAE